MAWSETVRNGIHQHGTNITSIPFSITPYIYAHVKECIFAQKLHHSSPTDPKLKVKANERNKFNIHAHIHSQQFKLKSNYFLPHSGVWYHSKAHVRITSLRGQLRELVWPVRYDARGRGTVCMSIAQTGCWLKVIKRLPRRDAVCLVCLMTGCGAVWE